MADYADVVVERATAHAPRPLVLCGWSLGGLVVLMTAERLRPDLVVLLEPSPPAEVQGSDPGLPLIVGTFDPEGAYGPFPEGVPARPESALARAERKRGISVPSLFVPIGRGLRSGVSRGQGSSHRRSLWLGNAGVPGTRPLGPRPRRTHSRGARLHDRSPLGLTLPIRQRRAPAGARAAIRRVRGRRFRRHARAWSRTYPCASRPRHTSTAPGRGASRPARNPPGSARSRG